MCVCCRAAACVQSNTNLCVLSRQRILEVEVDAGFVLGVMVTLTQQKYNSIALKWRTRVLVCCTLHKRSLKPEQHRCQLWVLVHRRGLCAPLTRGRARNSPCSRHVSVSSANQEKIFTKAKPGKCSVLPESPPLFP